MKKIPQSFSFEDNWQNILKLEELLRKRGLDIRRGSLLEQASLVLLEMVEVSKNKAVHNQQVDCRESWRCALSLADIARKILRAASRPDFEALMPHVKLLRKSDHLSQFSAVSNSATPKQKEINNKIFELFVAVVLFQICSDLKFDHPNSSKGDNPDVIGKFKGKIWGFACKTSHSLNPKSILKLVRSGIRQINKAKVERGIVIVNFKNLIPHDEIWPARFDSQTGKWGYQSLLNRDYPKILIEQVVENFEQAVFEEAGGYQSFINNFAGTKTIPAVFVFSCTVAILEKSSAVRGPIVIKRMSKIGTPYKDLDSEASELLTLFNDYLYDNEQNFIPV